MTHLLIVDIIIIIVEYHTNKYKLSIDLKQTSENRIMHRYLIYHTFMFLMTIENQNNKYVFMKDTVM